MKFLTYIAAAALLSSCDNYLDIVPKGESVLYRTSDYIGLLEDPAGYPIGAEWYVCGERSSHNMDDLVNYTAPLNSAGYYLNEAFDRASYMTDDASFLYAPCYKRISNYNIIIDNIADSEGSDADKTMGLAQAKIMRAYNYFYLINTYAKPYDPNTAEEDRGIILRDNFNMEEKGVQSSVADAYRLIQKDIEDALPDLPHMASNNFRPDKSFGYGLKAKVHLFKREITEALQASLDCIKEAEENGGHKLWNMNTAYDAWLASATYGMADMIPYYEYGGLFYSMRQQDQMAPTPFMVSAFNNPEHLLYQNGLNSMDPHGAVVARETMALFTPLSDIRYTFSMGMMSRPTLEPGGASLMNNNIKWNCAGMKLSEAYLMAAECYARQGNAEKAMKYVNDLRKNRIIAKYYEDLEAETSAEAMKIVREERKRDLLLTSNGFFDMRRFCAEFNETVTREFYVNNESGAPTLDKTVSIAPDSHLLTFPFPVSAMQNSDLTQNSK